VNTMMVFVKNKYIIGITFLMFLPERLVSFPYLYVLALMLPSLVN